MGAWRSWWGGRGISSSGSSSQWRASATCSSPSSLTRRRWSTGSARRGFSPSPAPSITFVTSSASYTVRVIAPLVTTFLALKVEVYLEVLDQFFKFPAFLGVRFELTRDDDEKQWMYDKYTLWIRIEIDGFICLIPSYMNPSIHSVILAATHITVPNVSLDFH